MSLTMPPQRRYCRGAWLPYPLRFRGRRRSFRRNLAPNDVVDSFTTTLGWSSVENEDQKLGSPAAPDVGWTSTFTLTEPYGGVGTTLKFVSTFTADQGALATGRYRR